MDRPRVYVTRRIPEEGLELLRARCAVEVNPDDRPLTRAELLEKVRGRDGLLCLVTDRIDREALEAAAGLRGLANYAVGFDNIDVAEAIRRGLPVSNTPDVLTEATAEMAWALLFATSRRVVESDRHLRAGRWQGWGPLQFLGQEVTRATLGVVGAGRIGTAMALKSRGFAMRLLYHDGQANRTLEGELGALRVGLDELLAQADFVSLHVPLRPETRHLIGWEQLNRMKRSAFLINTSRGPVVDEAALVRALREGVIAGAGLDVFEREPEMEPGLAEMDNVVITPHTASATVTARTGMAVVAARNLLAMVEGRPAPDCVNPQVYRG